MQSFAVSRDLEAVFSLPVIGLEDWEAIAYGSTPWTGIVNRAIQEYGAPRTIRGQARIPSL
ncbi:MAG: hypothetical protein OXK72_05045 [Gammaproteobacteria bacterium]|nr:hypothetical protein [Gammaproteobacteria bacterium]